MEAYVIVHSVFCFTLLFVCVLHVCVSAWSGVLLCFTPTNLRGVPRLVLWTQFFNCLLSISYPPPPAFDSFPSFFNPNVGPQ